MKTAKQAHREAKRLFRFCVVNGSLDEDRARAAARRLADARRPGAIPVLSRFHRLVRLDRAKRAIEVESAVPLPPELRTELEAKLTRLYGSERITSFTSDPDLLGGVRITIGSTVYDGTIRGRLAALEAQL